MNKTLKRILGIILLLPLIALLAMGIIPYLAGAATFRESFEIVTDSLPLTGIFAISFFIGIGMIASSAKSK